MLEASVSRSSLQAISVNTSTPVSFDTADFNVSGMWSAAQPTRLTIPAAWGATSVVVAGCIDIEANSSGVRSLLLRKNGTTTLVEKVVAATSSHSGNDVVKFLRAAGGDYFELLAYQNGLASLNVITSNFPPSFTLAVV